MLPTRNVNKILVKTYSNESWASIFFIVFTVNNTPLLNHHVKGRVRFLY